MSYARLTNQRKIIHIDMDCFYAAIEIRDNPALADKPVAVGGASNQRGVLCTCNYIARQYGVRSAMATSMAYRLCKDLIVLPVNFAKYKQIAKKIHAIFNEFTDLVEPLSLDEAFLDVSDIKDYHGSATLIAKAIRQRIWNAEHLTASAGVAPNKFLAKIASGWQKPNGLFVIKPDDVQTFIATLPVKELFGVGRVTSEKLHRNNLRTCADLQTWSLTKLVAYFGKLGLQLYNQSRGIDDRPVNNDRIRKSLSVETTLIQDLYDTNSAREVIKQLVDKLKKRLQESTRGYTIKNQFVKVKFNNFKQTTAEVISSEADISRYLTLFDEIYKQKNRPIRLLGVGVHFKQPIGNFIIQQTLL
jgi:DNA polymerase-4